MQFALDDLLHECYHSPTFCYHQRLQVISRRALFVQPTGPPEVDDLLTLWPFSTQGFQQLL